MTLGKPMSVVAVALMSALIAAPSFAQPYGPPPEGPPPPDGPPPPPPPPGYYDSNPNYGAYRYYADSCGREKHDAHVAGAILGTIAGALIGNGVSRGGGRAGGTIIGGVAGGVAGSAIAGSTVHCDGPRPYWTYTQTVALDAYPGYPGRYDNGWYWRHHCRWVQSDRGWLRVCPAGNGYFYPTY